MSSHYGWIQFSFSELAATGFRGLSKLVAKSLAGERCGLYVNDSGELQIRIGKRIAPLTDALQGYLYSTAAGLQVRALRTSDRIDICFVQELPGQLFSRLVFRVVRDRQKIWVVERIRPDEEALMLQLLAFTTKAVAWEVPAEGERSGDSTQWHIAEPVSKCEGALTRTVVVTSLPDGTECSIQYVYRANCASPLAEGLWILRVGAYFWRLTLRVGVQLQGRVGGISFAVSQSESGYEVRFWQMVMAEVGKLNCTREQP